MTLFDTVKMLADKRKMSLNDVEEVVGFSRNTLYKWKNSKPNTEKLEAIADYFGVSTDYLLGRSEEETELREALKGVLSFDGKEMTEEDKEAIITYMMGRKSK